MTLSEVLNNIPWQRGVLIRGNNELLVDDESRFQVRVGEERFPAIVVDDTASGGWEEWITNGPDGQAIRVVAMPSLIS